MINLQHFLENRKSILFCVKKKFIATFVDFFHFPSILDRHLPFFYDQMTSFLGKTVSDREKRSVRIVLGRFIPLPEFPRGTTRTSLSLGSKIWHFYNTKWGLFMAILIRFLTEIGKNSDWWHMVCSSLHFLSMRIQYIPLFGPKIGNNYDNIQERHGFYLWGSKSVQDSCPVSSKKRFLQGHGCHLQTEPEWKTFPWKDSVFSSRNMVFTHLGPENTSGDGWLTKSNTKFQKFKEILCMSYYLEWSLKRKMKKSKLK